MNENFHKMQSLCIEGDKLSEEQEWEKAIQKYDEAASLLEKGEMNLTYDAINELLSTVYYNRGNAYAVLKNDESAISDFVRCRKNFPSFI